MRFFCALMDDGARCWLAVTGLFESLRQPRGGIVRAAGVKDREKRRAGGRRAQAAPQQLTASDERRPRLYCQP